MKQRTHRRVFWAAVLGAFCGILSFTKTQSWAAVLAVGACAVIALIAGQAGDIEKEGTRWTL